MSKLQANVLLVQIYEKRKKTIKLNHDIEGIINGLAFGLYLLSVLIYLFIISRYLDINSFSDILGLYHKRCSVNGFLIAIHLISLVFCGFVIVFEGYESKEKGFFIESFSFFFGISIYIFALVLYQYKCLSHWSSFYGIFGQILALLHKSILS